MAILIIRTGNSHATLGVKVKSHWPLPRICRNGLDVVCNKICVQIYQDTFNREYNTPHIKIICTCQLGENISHLGTIDNLPRVPEPLSSCFDGPTNGGYVLNVPAICQGNVWPHRTFASIFRIFFQKINKMLQSYRYEFLFDSFIIRKYTRLRHRLYM